VVSLNQHEVATLAEAVQVLEGHLVHGGGLDVQVLEAQPALVVARQHVLGQLGDLRERNNGTGYRKVIQFIARS
jgi:hypothetical protein